MNSLCYPAWTLHGGFLRLSLTRFLRCRFSQFTALGEDFGTNTRNLFADNKGIAGQYRENHGSIAYPSTKNDLSRECQIGIAGKYSKLEFTM